MKVAVTGSNGQVGTALTRTLRGAGHSVVRLVRRTPESADEVFWSPEDGHVDADGLRGINAAVHLAGEPLAAGRWTGARKARIRRSRVRGTHILAEALAALDPQPATLICASGMGYYGDRGEGMLTETSASGRGFLAGVAIESEAAAAPASDAGIRTVYLRSGLILSAHGDPLRRMLPLFRAWLGAALGNGRQYWPWIALEDTVGVIQHAVANETVSGPVNSVAPQQVTNAEFTATLNRVLGRRTLLRAPTFAVRALMGEMGIETLLNSMRMQPAVLEATGFEFQYPELEGALRHALSEA